MPDDLRDELDAFMEGDELLAPPTDLTPVEIDGLDQANRFLRRLARLERDADEVHELARAEFERIAAWEADRMSGIERTQEWLEGSLEGFLRAYSRATGNKTVKLPCGTLALRKKQPRLVEANVVTLADAVRDEHPDWLNTTTKAGIASIKGATKPGPQIDDDDERLVRVDVPPDYTAHEAVVESSGEVIPGVVYLVPIVDTANVSPRREFEDEQ